MILKKLGSLGSHEGILTIPIMKSIISMRAITRSAIAISLKFGEQEYRSSGEVDNAAGTGLILSR
jgi:hypothetical protein